MVDGVTERTAALTANVTGILIGELLAPGADRVTVPLYVPCGNPAGFTETVNVPGVKVVEVVAVIHEVLLVTAHVVFAPPAVTLIVWGAGVNPGPALKTRLPGVMASSVTWFWTAAT